MRFLARFLSLVSAFFGLWSLVRSPKGAAGGMVWMPKLLAGAWSPLWALSGLAGGLASLLRRDMWSAFAGLAGAGLAVRHIRRVTRPGDQFESALGPDWKARIPASVRARLPVQRYRLVRPAPADFPFQQNIVIGRRGTTQEPLLADLWLPPAGVPGSGLGLVYLHATLWQAMDKDYLTRPLFRRLASQGHTILDVAYSLAPQADLFDMLYEVKRAIAWMKAHAVELGLHPRKIALMGHSGGAHLALLAAYAPQHPDLQAPDVAGDGSVCGVITFYGITDMSAFFREYGRSNPGQPEYSAQIRDELRPRLHDATSLERWLTKERIFPAYRHANMPGGALLLVYLLGGTLAEAPERYRLVSPLEHVGPHCPPTMQVMAAEDFVVDASHGRRLHRRLAAAGVPSVYIEFPDSVHGFDNYFGVSRQVSPASQAALVDLEYFLGWLAGSA